MKFVVYVYDGMTALDAVGPYDLLNRLPEAQFVFAGDGSGPKSAAGGLTILASVDFRQVRDADVILLPGGGQALAREIRNTELLDWIRQLHENTQYTTSVCTGALLLGAAGLLEGAAATTHWRARGLLTQFGATYVDRRVSEHGRILTAAGVTAGLDLALVLAREMCGEQVARAIQLSTEYNPRPPFPPCTYSDAPSWLLDLVADDLKPRES